MASLIWAQRNREVMGEVATVAHPRPHSPPEREALTTGSNGGCQAGVSTEGCSRLLLLETRNQD